MIEISYSQLAIGGLIVAGVFMLIGMILGKWDAERKYEPEDWDIYDQEPYIREITKDD